MIQLDIDSQFQQLPGEDRMLGGTALFVDFIPATCWFKNVRSAIAPRDWDALRYLIYSRSNDRCEICQTRGALHAHERWTFNADTATQRLGRLIALCPACHEATHYGFASLQGRAEIAFQHLRRINDWTAAQTHTHIAAAVRTFLERSAHRWELDLSILVDASVRLRPPRP